MGAVGGTANPDYRLWVACDNGCVNSVHALLADDRVDPRAYDSVALRLACKKGHVQVAQALLADGRARPDACNGIALRNASEKGYVDVVRALLADGRAARNKAVDAGRGHKQAQVVRTCKSKSAWFACAN